MPRKKSVRRAARPARASRKPTAIPTKRSGLRIVTKNFVLFLVLFALSVVFGLLTSNEVLDQLFWILAILTGFVAVAFLLVMLIMMFMKAFRK